MTPLQEMVFIDEIALQSKIAQRAAERLKATHDNYDGIEVWCSIQSILVATANVSKILWPTSTKYKMRGETLRKMLHVEMDNPLSDRKFRNHFEHYDERIEKWFDENKSPVYSDLAINPSLQGSMGSSSHRGYNSFNNTLVFRGVSLNLSEILEALGKILDACRQYTLT